MLEPQVQIVELGDREVGLVYKNERLAGVLAPGTRQLYWRGPVKVRVEVRDIAQEYALDARHGPRADAHQGRERRGARSARSRCRTRRWAC